MAAGNLEVMVERAICEDRETPVMLILSSGADSFPLLHGVVHVLLDGAD